MTRARRSFACKSGPAGADRARPYRSSPADRDLFGSEARACSPGGNPVLAGRLSLARQPLAHSSATRLAGSDFQLASVVVDDVHGPRLQQPDVVYLAALASHARLDALRPSPPRLQPHSRRGRTALRTISIVVLSGVPVSPGEPRWPVSRPAMSTSFAMHRNRTRRSKPSICDEPGAHLLGVRPRQVGSADRGLVAEC